VSLVVLDDHLSVPDVRASLLRWATVEYMRDLRPGEVVKDDRVLTVLRTLRTPTFVTVDRWFWNPQRRDPRYCIVYLALRGRDHTHAPDLLRRLLRLPEFRTRAARMGTVVHVGEDHVRWWRVGDDSEHAVYWDRPSRRRT
jgi:hypothetical protein